MDQWIVRRFRNGSNGGPFSFRMDVLPGNVDNSNGVNISDVFDTYARSGSVVNSFALASYDVNGNGGINISDVFDIYALSGSILPNASSMTQSDGATSSFASSDGQTVEAGDLRGPSCSRTTVEQLRPSIVIWEGHPQNFCRFIRLDRALSRAMAWMSPPMDRPSEEDQGLSSLEGTRILQFVPIGILHRMLKEAWSEYRSSSLGD